MRSYHQNISFVDEKEPARVAQYLTAIFAREARNHSLVRDSSEYRTAVVDRLNGIVGNFLNRNGHPNWYSAFQIRPKSSRNGASLSPLPFYLADQIRIEEGKLSFGMEPPSTAAVNLATDLVIINFRYLFEARGIGIDNWSYNDIIGTYHMSLRTMILDEDGLASIMMRSDRDLSFRETLELKSTMSGSFQDLFQFEKAESSRVCSALRRRSLDRMRGVSRPTVFDLRSSAVLADQNWEHHFTNTGKIPGLPADLPTNPVSKRNCTQCHFGYVANYTGPEFIRSSKSYPLAMMYCANCHADESPTKIAPYIPFHDEFAFKKFIADNPGDRLEIGIRLGEGAKGQLLHMPPVFFLKPKDLEMILGYLRTM